MLQITIAMSKSKKAAQRRMLDANSVTKCDNSPRDSVSKEVEFLTREQQQKIFSDFLTKRRREEQRRYKSERLDKRKVLNNFEELNNESNYEDDNSDNDIDDEYIDEYTDDFEDETRK